MSDGGIFEFPAKRSISEQREWNQFLAHLDRGDCDDDEPTPTPIVETPAPRPENARVMHRLSCEAQDAWSDRMRARYGDER